MKNLVVKTNKYGESLRRIAVRLTGISVSDMTTAERQIAEILEETGIMEQKITADGNEYVTVKKVAYNKG